MGLRGSGPTQLALALVADRLGPGREDEAMAIYQDFKWFWVARLPKRNWIVSGSELDSLIDMVIAVRNKTREASARRGQRDVRGEDDE